MKQLTNSIYTRIILLLCLLNCTTNSTGQIIQGEKRVVFTKDNPVRINLIKDTFYIRFTPTIDDIEIADSLLHHYFLTVNSSDDNFHPLLEKYYRQYVGFWLNAQKCIYINASYRKSDYFLQNTFYPKGGGQGYFQTIVDIGNKKVSNFHFNAPK